MQGVESIRTRRWPAATLFCSVAAMVTLLGCRTPQPRSWHSEDLEPKRELRKQEATARFEEKRNNAQFAAALSRYELGDTAGCHESLEALLKRNPQHAEAAQLLSQVKELEQLSQEEVATAGWVRSAGGSAGTDVAQASAALTGPSGSLTGAPGSLPSPAAAGPPASTYVRGTDTPAASLCLGPANPADATHRLPVYRTDLTKYEGSARGDVAKRSVRQAVESLALGDVIGAETYYQAATAAEPENTELLLAAAAMSLRYDQEELALKLAQSATSLYPSDPGAQRTLAMVYYRQGNYRASQDTLCRAISLDKAHPLSYFLMGSTLRKLGETSQADWHFQQAAQLDPSYASRR